MDRQYVGIDFHRRRSVIVRKNAAGEKLSAVRVANDPVRQMHVRALGLQPVNDPVPSGLNCATARSVAWPRPREHTRTRLHARSKTA